MKVTINDKDLKQVLEILDFIDSRLRKMDKDKK